MALTMMTSQIDEASSLSFGFDTFGDHHLAEAVFWVLDPTRFSQQRGAQAAG